MSHYYRVTFRPPTPSDAPPEPFRTHAFDRQQATLTTQELFPGWSIAAVQLDEAEWE